MSKKLLSFDEEIKAVMVRVMDCKTMGEMYTLIEAELRVAMTTCMLVSGTLSAILKEQGHTDADVDAEVAPFVAAAHEARKQFNSIQSQLNERGRRL